MIMMITTMLAIHRHRHSSSLRSSDVFVIFLLKMSEIWPHLFDPVSGMRTRIFTMNKTRMYVNRHSGTCITAKFYRSTARTMHMHAIHLRKW